jgi:HSP20 family protein
MFNLIPWNRKSQATAKRETYATALEPFNRMRSELDRLTADFFSGFWPAIAEQRFGWDFHVEDQDDAVVVTAEAPGFEPDDFEISVEGNQLVLRAEHKADTEGKEKKFHEHCRQQFYRSMTLPAFVRSDAAEARYKSGVLTVRLPKTEESKPKRIAITQ